MDIFTQQKGVYVFGPFRLDPVRRSLLRDGVPVKLGERLFETLRYLVEHHDRLVERDELLQAVWAGRRVEECNLGQAISGLRKALQTGPAAENYIVTVAGRGYRFAAPVEIEPAPVGTSGLAPAPPAEAGAEAAQSYRRSRAGISRPAHGVLAVVVLVGVSAGFWRFFSAPRTPSQVSQASFAPPPRSLAVLAFRNLDGDATQEYFSDGVSEELINVLGRVGGLRLAAATSSFSFKGKPVTIGDVARQLNVGAVLEGSVRRDAARLRVSVDLVDATTGFQIWSNTYDRDRGDIFAIQDDIAQAVAVSLKVALREGKVPKLALGGTKNPKAYDAYLLGLRSLTGPAGGNGDRQAIAAFDAAIALDPNFADAHVDRALAIADLVEFGWEPDVPKAMSMLADALADTNRAIADSPDLGRAYAARAMVELDLSRDFSGATTDYGRARALLPDNPWVIIKYGLFETYLGHSTEGVATAERAVSLDPLGEGIYLRLAETYYFARRFDDALAALRHAEVMGDSGVTRGRGLRGFIRVLSGDAEGARRDCATQRDLLEAECTVIALHVLGKLPEASAALATLQKVAGERAAYNYAEIYAQWGQRDQALHWLQRAFELHDNGLLFLKVDPFLDPIRNEPTFADIKRKMRFPT